MARLAGSTLALLASDYTDQSFSGFGGGVSSYPLYVADVAGTIENVVVNITTFNNDPAIRCNLYKRRGGSGSFSLEGYGEVATGTAAPQTVSLTLVGDGTCEIGDEFLLIMIGTLSGTSPAGDGEFFRASIDNSVTFSTTEPLAGVITIPTGTQLDIPPAATFDPTTRTPEADGQMWFQVDGTAGAATDLQASVEMRNAAGNLITNTDFLVRVTANALSGAELVAEATIQTDGSGILLVDNQGLGSADSEVWVEVRAVGESDADIAKLVYPVIVVDANA